MTPILHHYDASPFSRKAQKMLGIKQLLWASVEMPMTAPKPDIERLTGGYRGTPVLQLGADFFVDNLAIAEALDRVYPETPSLSGPTSGFVDAAIGYWADQLFEPVLRAAVGKFATDWDDDFRADRQAVFPHLDFNRLPLELPNFSHQIVTMVRELADHLSSHGPFINGAAASLADVHCWGILWFVLAGLPEASEHFTELSILHDWYGAVEAIGFGHRKEQDYASAWGVLAAAQGQPAALDLTGPPAFVGWVGSDVRVRALGADRGTVQGVLQGADNRLISLAVSQQNGAVSRVYFPRSGYLLEHSN